MAEQEATRRELIQRAVYVAPAILTLVAFPRSPQQGLGQSLIPGVSAYGGS